MLRRYNGQSTGGSGPMVVIKLDKSGGCVDRDESFMQQLRHAQVREYFFGDAKTTLSPHTQQLDFDQLSIYKVAESQLPLFSIFLRFNDTNHIFMCRICSPHVTTSGRGRRLVSASNIRHGRAISQNAERHISHRASRSK